MPPDSAGQRSAPPAGLRVSAPAASTPTGPTARPRFEVVDALRGVAAAVVVLQHGAEMLWPGYGRWSVEVFRPGEWGVLVFFLVSGFVIPLSIERDRDPASFWIGRACRLFPLYWAVLAAAVGLWLLGLYQAPGAVGDTPIRQLLLNATLFQNFLGSTSMVGAAWSLAYEMVFYLFITVLLVTRVRGGAVGSTLIVLAAASTLGLLLPPRFLMSGGEAPGDVAVIAAGLVAGALAITVPRMVGRTSRIVGALTVTALVLLTVNQSLDLWFSLLLFATIGCGWVYHEAHAGRVDPWVPVATSALTVAVAAYHLNRWVQPHEGDFGATVTWGADALTLAMAHLAFGLVYLARHRGFHRSLRWLGTISYSLYLIHALVIHSVGPFRSRVLTLACWVVVTVAVSALTYRTIELPAQRAGARWRRRVRDRSDRRPAPRRGSDPVPGECRPQPLDPTRDQVELLSWPRSTLSPEWVGSPSAGSSEMSTTS